MLPDFQVALAHSILKLKSIFIPLKKIVGSAEQNAQDYIWIWGLLAALRSVYYLTGSLDDPVDTVLSIYLETSAPCVAGARCAPRTTRPRCTWTRRGRRMRSSGDCRRTTNHGELGTVKIVCKDPLALWFEALDNVNIYAKFRNVPMLDLNNRSAEC